MIQQYIDRINTRFRTGISREHSYRGDLQNLLESLCPGILVTNEPARVACGAPDYILTKGKIPVGYIEAKDIGEDLLNKKHKEQFDRYRSSLPSLIFTDYLDFRLYRDGEFISSVRIASIQNGKIAGHPEKYEDFLNLIKEFSSYTGQTIKSPKKLAEMMAGKARMLANIIENAILADEAENTNTVHEAANNTLREQMEAFKQVLIHDIQAKEFADIYAQTIAYGMFAARLHDPTLDDFSRQEAAELIPKSNPFLRKLFQYIAGYDLDDRIKWIVDALADIFRATDVAALLKNFGKATQQNDPMIHFYETFLGAYDPKLKKARGVWYTPEPVVNFIVRAVDDILKTEFGLKDGLADTTKTKIKVNTQIPNKNFKSGYKEVEQEVHKVQILDPATGTGTFLAEVVKHIYKNFEGQQGIWSNYVENHLLPRLNGFELLMASYAMAHLKLELLLTETGYKPTKDQRLKVYLTNSLEEHHPDTGTLFANWLSTEANEANHIKRDTPVMCVIGNPPYSGESSNKGEWIMKLMEDYKMEPGCKNKLKEKNSKFINDDYVKFIRLSHYFIEKNGEGILAFINNHGFLDNPTFRGMRWSLLKTFDKIFIFDLHGNLKKKEVCPDGSPDNNVFDIQPGVSINIFIKSSNKSIDELGKVYHQELFGKRNEKYEFLWKNNLQSSIYRKLKISSPQYLFVPKNYEIEKEFNAGFKIDELIPENSLGLLTKRDILSIGFHQKELIDKISYFLSPERTTEEVCNKFNLVLKDKDKWDAVETRNSVPNNNISEFIRNCQYRPLDNRKVFYNPFFVARPNQRVLRHLIKDNIALVIGRQGQAVGGDDWNVLFVVNYLVDQNIFRRGGGTNFPLYLYPENNSQQTINQTTKRIPNFNPEIVNQIAEKLDLTFTNEKEQDPNTFAPIDLLDYIYAVLHSPTYREKYKEFLKIDFPRVPYPTNQITFWQLVKQGGELRQIHLLESETVENFITTYPQDGDNMVGRKMTKNSPGFELTNADRQLGKVWINDRQYFDGVPLTAWEFYIGGYQPAQKWLKDRFGRQLSFEDIRHYQKIIVALTETDRIMKEIDGIEIEG